MFYNYKKIKAKVDKLENDMYYNERVYGLSEIGKVKDFYTAISNAPQPKLIKKIIFELWDNVFILKTNMSGRNEIVPIKKYTDEKFKLLEKNIENLRKENNKLKELVREVTDYVYQEKE